MVKKIDQKEWVNFVKNKLHQSSKNIKSLSKQMKLDKEQVDPKLLEEFPFMTRVQRNAQGIIFPYQALKTTENTLPQSEVSNKTKVSTETTNQSSHDQNPPSSPPLSHSDPYPSNTPYNHENNDHENNDYEKHETNQQEAIDIDLSLSELFSTKKKITPQAPTNNLTDNDAPLKANDQMNPTIKTFTTKQYQKQ